MDECKGDLLDGDKSMLPCSFFYKILKVFVFFFLVCLNHYMFLSYHLLTIISEGSFPATEETLVCAFQSFNQCMAALLEVDCPLKSFSVSYSPVCLLCYFRLWSIVNSIQSFHSNAFQVELTICYLILCFGQSTFIVYVLYICQFNRLGLGKAFQLKLEENFVNFVFEDGAFYMKSPHGLMGKACDVAS